MTQDDIRKLLAERPDVHVQVAAEGDGSPPIAWGDTFFTVRDALGAPKKMPFATIVTKDYTGFDTESQLDRGGLFRVNVELGREAFTAAFGFAPKDLAQHRAAFDFAALDVLFPHPAYGEQGWASIINPTSASAETLTRLLLAALERASKRGA